MRAEPGEAILTSRGRVVYDRKPHKFKHCDLSRIAQKLGKPETDRQEACQLVAASQILQNIRGWTSEGVVGCVESVLEDLDTRAQEMYANNPEWGGGEFGGGGADRKWYETDTGGYIWRPFRWRNNGSK